MVVEAMESVLGQTRPASEIVVVDDGSTDDETSRMLRGVDHPRVRVCFRPHAGAAAARNHGANETTASYLLFLDGDDLLDPDYLRKTGALLDDDSSLDVVSTAMRGFGEASYVWTPPPYDLATALTKGAIPITALFRRVVWDRTGGFDETLPSAMDLEFWIRVMELGFRGTIVDEPLLERRVRADSLHHASVDSGRHLRILEQILRKHRSTIESFGPTILLEKSRSLNEQRQNRTDLESRQRELHRQLDDLNGRLSAARTQLEARTRPRVNLGDFERVTPFSDRWGLDRGRPVDRYYIENFLRRNRSDIHGTVLEVKDSTYTRRFGGDAVTSAAVLDIDAGNPNATVVADLTVGDHIPADSFDCFILTQTLQFIFDVSAAIRNAHRLLKPGGVLLATVPAVSRIDYQDNGIDGDFWRFTQAGLAEVFAEVFGAGSVAIAAAGNLKACSAFLYGLATEDLSQPELDPFDRRCPLVLCVRAVKSRPRAERPSAPAVQTQSDGTAIVLMYHRVAEATIDPHRLCVSPAEFRSHMEYIRERHRVMALDELATAVASRSIPDGALAITLDDGIVDSLTAADILTDLGIPATFFLMTDRLDEEHEPWWESLARILLGHDAVPAALSVNIGRQKQILSTDSPRHRADAYSIVHRALMHATLDERDTAMEKIIEWSGLTLPVRSTTRVLLPNEIQALAARPLQTIGAHSVHHLRLPLQSAADQEREIGDSKEHLERLLGRPVTLFSYPYGDRDLNTVERVRASGYSAAVTTVPGLVTGGADVFDLPRLDVKSDGVAGLARLLAETFAAARMSS
jgi:peptidoglycan/xylan/chitin deacetylase (PgdA/CDA1 family)/glycosyltransferase involved in cell wall biosynthesis